MLVVKLEFSQFARADKLKIIKTKKNSGKVVDF